MTEKEPEDQLDEMEKHAKEVDDQIEETESDWESTQQEVPSADDRQEDKPVDEDNPVGGV